MSKLTEKVNRFTPVAANIDHDMRQPSQLYEFSHEFMRTLFDPLEHRSTLVSRSVLDLLSLNETDFENKNIIIVSASGLPEALGNDESDHPDSIVLPDDETIFELRSIVMLQVRDKDYSANPSKFEAIRYMRHGGNYLNWWHQEREDHIATQCQVDPVAHISHLSADSESADDHFLEHVLVYVRVRSMDIDIWRLKILQSMGGQVHVRCACNKFPLIPTNARKDSKQKCHWCHRVKSFVCCNTKCNLRLCSRCYRDQQTDVITIIDPTFEVDDDNNPGDPSRDEEDDVASQGNDDNERENDDGYNDGVIHEEDSGKQKNCTR